MGFDSFLNKVKTADYKQVAEYVKETITTKYFYFDGRISLEGYWTYMLPVLVLSIIPVIGWIWGIATLLPSLGMSARRLHDTGKTGWLLLIGVIPVVGGLAIIYLCCQPGQPEANQYGEINEK